MKTLLIDLSHICYRNVFAIASDIKQVGFGIFRHAIIKSVLFNIEKFNPDKVYICCDAKRNWRKKFYEPYKGHRKEAKDKFDIDWDQFQETVNDVIEGFKEYFPFYVVQEDWLEADDVISYLVRFNPLEEKIILSSDSDFVQLLKYPNTKIYCPMKLQFNDCDNPNFHLARKIIMGDKQSDNIPAIRPGIGPKKAEKIIENDELKELLKDPILLENYNRNTKLIDLTRTPSQLIERLQNNLKNISVVHSRNASKYIVKHKMRDLFYNISSIEKLLATLNPKEDPVPLEQENPNP
jgi:5'-3' exonuclease